MSELSTQNQSTRPGSSDPGFAVPDCRGITGHCCWIGGEVCPFLRDDEGSTRRWVCTLRERLGSWEAVHSDQGYLDKVAPTMRALGQVDCGEWPGPGVTCIECGAQG